MEEEISLLDLWNVIRKHLGKLIGLTVLGGAIAIVIMKLLVSPMYQSTAQLLVNQNQVTDQTPIQFNEIQTNIQLINTYSDIITGDAILNKVIKNTGNIYEAKELKEAVAVNQSPNSQAFNVSVTLDSPENAQMVLNKIVEAFEETIEEVYKAEEPNIYILSEASLDAKPVSPNFLIFLFIGVIIGFIVAVIWAFIQELSDNSVKDEEYVSSMGLIILGQVNKMNEKKIQASRLGQASPRSRKRKRV